MILSDVQKRYRLKNKEKIRQNQLQYYVNNKEKFKEYQSNNSGKIKQYKTIFYKRLKVETLSHYGDLICKCGEEDLTKLTLDHVNEDGKAHRKKIGIGTQAGGTFYRYLKRNNYPNDPPLQILCRSCNTKKWHNLIHN